MAGIHNILLGLGSQSASSGSVSTLDMLDPFVDSSGVALYRFNGDAMDVSGNYNSTTSNITYGTGVFGQSALFSGNGYVNTGYTINPSGNSYTFSFWMKYTTGGTVIFGGESSSSTYTLLVTTMETSGKIRFFAYGGTGSMAETQTTLSPGVWYHVVCTIDSSTHTKKIYLNGVLDVQTSAFSGVSSYPFPLLIGAEYNTGTVKAFFNGSIDQFRVFNRALTADEVTILYTEIAA